CRLRRRASWRVPAFRCWNGGGSLPGEFREVAGLLPSVEAVAPDPHVLPLRNLAESRLQVAEREWPHGLAVMGVVPFVVGHRGHPSTTDSGFGIGSGDHSPSQSSLRRLRKLVCPRRGEQGGRSPPPASLSSLSAWSRSTAPL